MALLKVQVQGGAFFVLLRRTACTSKQQRNEAQRRNWIFYEAIKSKPQILTPVTPPSHRWLSIEKPPVPPA